MNQTLEIEQQNLHPLAIVTLKGFLARLEVYKIKMLGEGLINEGLKYIVLDLTAVSYIDSAGLGALLTLRAECQRHGGYLYLVQPIDSKVDKVLTTSTVGTLIPTFPDVRSATEHVSKKFSIPLPGEERPTPKDDEILVLLRKISERLERFEIRLNKLEKEIHSE